jgi:hypothetical protein
VLPTQRYGDTIVSDALDFVVLAQNDVLTLVHSPFFNCSCSLETALDAQDAETKFMMVAT